MTFAEECELARLEGLAAREAVRQAEYEKPLAESIRELLGVREYRNAEELANRREVARRALGSPPVGSSFTRGEAGRFGRLRNGRFV
jgi:predicted nucleic acid-binding Zn ribbon protein